MKLQPVSPLDITESGFHLHSLVNSKLHAFVLKFLIILLMQQQTITPAICHNKTQTKSA